MDGGTAFRHTTMLCMPVTHGARKPSKVLGVFQLVNKFDGLKFTRNDENFVEAFAIFCGMGINNVRMYEKTVVAMAKKVRAIRPPLWQPRLTWRRRLRII